MTKGTPEPLPSLSILISDCFLPQRKAMTRKTAVTETTPYVSLAV